MQSTLLPLIIFSHLLYWVRWYLKARYSTTGSIHFADHKAKRQTNPHDIRLFRNEESIFCTLIMECVVCTHDTWYKVQKIFLFKNSLSCNYKNWIRPIMQPAIPLAPSHLLRNVVTSITVRLLWFLSIPARLRYCYCIALRRCALRFSAEMQIVHRFLFGSVPIIQ